MNRALDNMCKLMNVIYVGGMLIGPRTLKHHCMLEGKGVVRLVRELKILGPLSKSIRSIECKLVKKIITRMDWRLRDEDN
jgi:hypothetical protein